MAQRKATCGATAPRAIALLVSVSALALGAGCGEESGDPGPAGLSGGPPGSPCAPSTANEGCTEGPTGPVRMRCDAATATWQPIAACPAEHRCVEFPTTGGVGNSTECRPINNIDAGSQEPDAGPQPALKATIATVATSEYLFNAGAAGGDAQQQAVVLLQSVGAVPLVISKLDWSSKNFSLQTKMLKGKPTLPMELDVGANFELVVLYSYDAAFPDTSSGTLLIESDDPAQPQLKLTFGFATVGGTMSPATAKLEFVDPEPGKGDVQCVELKNIGDGEVTFDKAVFETAGKLWQVSAAPAAGSKLAAGSEDSWQFCAKVKPAGPDVQHDNALLIHITDAINSPVRVELVVKWVAVGDFLLKCEAIDGTAVYDFRADKVQAKRLCTLTNKIELPMSLASVAVVAKEKQYEILVAKLFEVDPYTIEPGDGQVSFVAPKTLLTNATAFLPVTFYPSAAELTDAELRIDYTHGSKTDTLVIPILAKP